MAASTTFAEMPLMAPVQRALRDVFRYTTPSDVQQVAIPLALTGTDLMVKAKTGSGKTLAFMAPLIDRLLRDGSSALGVIGGPIRALVLSPSRELADQTRREAMKLATYAPDLGIQLVIGGDSEAKQAKALNTRPCDILIATPGRLVAHIKSLPGFVDRLRAGIEILVLDECDRLLDGGFQRDLTLIRGCLPARGMQTLLFTATVPEGVVNVALAYLRSDAKYIEVRGPPEEANSDSHARIVQEHVVLPPSADPLVCLYRVLAHKIRERPDFRIIVFFVNVNVTAAASALFRRAGMPVLEMHSGLNQSQRTRAAATFHKSPGHILFASDVIARGIDFPDVTLVIQVGITDPAQYEHRVGRTGRAGKTGEALLILTEAERPLIGQLQKMPLVPASAASKITHGLTATSRYSRPSALQTAREAMEAEQLKLLQSTFKSLLGSYISKKGQFKWTRDRVVEVAKTYAGALGLHSWPVIKEATLQKLGLSGVVI